MKKYTKETYHQYLMTLLPESNFTIDNFNGTEYSCTITCQTCKKVHNFSTAATIARRALRNNKNVCKYCEKNDWTARQELAKNKALYLLNKKGN